MSINYSIKQEIGIARQVPHTDMGERESSFFFPLVTIQIPWCIFVQIIPKNSLTKFYMVNKK